MFSKAQPAKPNAGPGNRGPRNLKHSQFEHFEQKSSQKFVGQKPQQVNLTESKSKQLNSRKRTLLQDFYSRSKSDPTAAAGEKSQGLKSFDVTQEEDFALFQNSAAPEDHIFEVETAFGKDKVTKRFLSARMEMLNEGQKSGQISKNEYFKQQKRLQHLKFELMKQKKRMYKADAVNLRNEIEQEYDESELKQLLGNAPIPRAKIIYPPEEEPAYKKRRYNRDEAFLDLLKEFDSKKTTEGGAPFLFVPTAENEKIFGRGPNDKKAHLGFDFEIENEGIEKKEEKVAETKKVEGASSKKEEKIEQTQKKTPNVEQTQKKTEQKTQKIEEIPKKAEKAQQKTKKVEETPKKVEIVKKTPKKVEIVEKTPKKAEIVEKAPKKEEIVEKAPKKVEIVEKTPKKAETKSSKKEETPKNDEISSKKAQKVLETPKKAEIIEKNPKKAEEKIQDTKPSAKKEEKPSKKAEVPSKDKKIKEKPSKKAEIPSKKATAQKIEEDEDVDLDELDDEDALLEDDEDALLEDEEDDAETGYLEDEEDDEDEDVDEEDEDNAMEIDEEEEEKPSGLLIDEAAVNINKSSSNSCLFEAFENFKVSELMNDEDDDDLIIQAVPTVAETFFVEPDAMCDAYAVVGRHMNDEDEPRAPKFSFKEKYDEKQVKKLALKNNKSAPQTAMMDKNNFSDQFQNLCTNLQKLSEKISWKKVLFLDSAKNEAFEEIEKTDSQIPHFVEKYPDYAYFLFLQEFKKLSTNSFEIDFSSVEKFEKSMRNMCYFMLFCKSIGRFFTSQTPMYRKTIKFFSNSILSATQLQSDENSCKTDVILKVMFVGIVFLNFLLHKIEAQKLPNAEKELDPEFLDVPLVPELISGCKFVFEKLIEKMKQENDEKSNIFAQSLQESEKSGANFRILHANLVLLQKLSIIYSKSKREDGNFSKNVAFPEIFSHFSLKIAKNLENSLPNSLQIKKVFDQTFQNLNSIIEDIRSGREPLQWLVETPFVIGTRAPLFDVVEGKVRRGTKDRKNTDLGTLKAERQKQKKEKRGVMRDIKRDNEFMQTARQKERERQDLMLKKQYKRALSIIQSDRDRSLQGNQQQIDDMKKSARERKQGRKEKKQKGGKKEE